MTDAAAAAAAAAAIAVVAAFLDVSLSGHSLTSTNTIIEENATKNDHAANYAN